MAELTSSSLKATRGDRGYKYFILVYFILTGVLKSIDLIDLRGQALAVSMV